MSALENAALNGDLFRPHRSPSPARSISSSQANTDDELGSDLSRPSSPSNLHPPAQPTAAPTGGAQTGVKGVINDRQAHTRASHLASDLQKRATIAYQEKHTITGLTSTEEDKLRERERERYRESEEDALAREKWRASRKAELIRGESMKESEADGGSRRGGLREIGKEGFLNAVERPGWTVILIYEPVRPPTTSTPWPSDQCKIGGVGS